MKYLILIIYLSSCSYSIHEHNLTTQQSRMIKYDEKSKRNQQRIRSKGKHKKKHISFNRSKRKYI